MKMEEYRRNLRETWENMNGIRLNTKRIFRDHEWNKGGVYWGNIAGIQKDSGMNYDGVMEEIWR